MGSGGEYQFRHIPEVCAAVAAIGPRGASVREEMPRLGDAHSMATAVRAVAANGPATPTRSYAFTYTLLAATGLSEVTARGPPQRSRGHTCSPKKHTFTGFSMQGRRKR